MYVGNKHTATVEQLVPLDDQCNECGWQQLAVVHSWGQGQGNSAFFLDEDGAKERAQNSAGEAAQKNAEKMLALASCPKCFTPDAKAIARFRRNNILTYLAFIAGCALFGLLLSALIETAWAIGIPTMAVAAGIWVASAQNRAIERGASTRVLFPKNEPEDDQAAVPLEA